MSDNININVTENIDQVNIVASEVVEVVDLNLYATTEDVTINVTEEIIQVNINKVTSSNITKTSDLINDGEDGTSTYVETDELGAVAFSNDYNDLDNLPTIPESVTKTSDLTNDGEDGVNPFITLEDIPPIDISTLVPYTGATQDVDLGENGISAGFFKFDTTPTDIPEVQGAMFWDEDDNTVDVILNGYRMKIGEDTFYPVKNQSGSTITKGTNVKFAGTVGSSGRLLILPFLANGTDASYVYMGVTAEDIADGEDGKVLWFGRLRGLNTNAFNEGDILYASTTSAGGFQNTIPTGANNIVQVSAVIKKSINQGVIFIRPQIEPLLFKPISGTGANGQVAFWNGTNSQTGDNGLFWDNTNKRLGVGATPLTTVRLDVRAQGALSTDIAFRVRNSANTANLFEVNGVGGIKLNNVNYRESGVLSIFEKSNVGNLYFRSNTADIILNDSGYGNVMVGGPINNPSAKLSIHSTTQGFLPPRMTNAQRLAIASPAVGLMVYCTDAIEGVYVNTSTGWKSLTMV